MSQHNSSKNLGLRIRHARRQLNLSQEQLGAEAGFSPMAISYFESGARNVNEDGLARIATALNTTPDNLMRPIVETPVSFRGEVTYGRISSELDPEEISDVKKSIDEFDRYVESQSI